LKEDTATSILTRWKLSVKQVARFAVLAQHIQAEIFDGKVNAMPGKRGLQPKAKLQGKAKVQEDVARLRVLAHDLSNALEAILQASYLLSHGKLETESKRWAHLIETSSEDAARINREMRKLMRSLGEE